MPHKIQQRTFDPDRVRQNFRNLPGIYDYWAKLTESKAGTRVLEWAAIREGETVLEVGTGTGILFERILRENKTGFVAGIDLSPDMLAKARERTEKYKGKQNFSLEKGSAYKIAFPSETFDGLICCYVLDLLPEKDFADILEEFKRVLKPEGRLLLASMTFGSKWYHRFWEWMSRTAPRLITGCRPLHLQPSVKEAGFSIEKIETISQNTFPSQIIDARKASPLVHLPIS